MVEDTRLKIRTAKRGEQYHAGWGGHYSGPDSRIRLLTRAHATTLSTMMKLKSQKEQFEFFCVAYLRELPFRMIAAGGDEVLEFERQLIDKYGSPWSGNIKNTLPAIEELWPDRAVIKQGGGLDTKRLRQHFSEYKKYEFILYTNEVFGPPLDDRGRPANPGDQLWDLEVGNYTYYRAGPYERAFAIPNTMDFPELRKRLVAAALSINLGIDSIDHALKNYTDYVELGKTEEPGASLLDILDKLKSHLRKFEEEHRHQHDDHEMLGIVAASYALGRCQSTFEACLVLSGRGFFVDACILGRHVIEQVAWALRIADLNDMNALWKVEPQKCISELKFHPYGRQLYSDLTEFAHLSAKSRHEYIRMIDDRPITIHRSTKEALRLSPLLILALDVYLSGCELFYMKECSQTNWQSWKITDGGPTLRNKRPLSQLFEQHRSKYKSPIGDLNPEIKEDTGTTEQAVQSTKRF